MQNKFKRTYCHPMFQKGEVQLCMQMKREEKYFRDTRRESVSKPKLPLSDTSIQDNITSRSDESFVTFDDVAQGTSVSWTIKNLDDTSSNIYSSPVPPNGSAKCLLNHTEDPPQRDWMTKDDCAYIETDYEFDPLLEWEEMDTFFKTNESLQEAGKNVCQDIHADKNFSATYCDTKTSMPCVYTIQNVSDEHSNSVFSNAIHPTADSIMNSNTFPLSFHQGAMYVPQQHFMIPPSTSMAQNAMHLMPAIQNCQPFYPSFTSISEYIHVWQQSVFANTPTTASNFSYYDYRPYFHITTTNSASDVDDVAKNTTQNRQK